MMVAWRFLGEPVVEPVKLEPVKLVNVDATPRAVRVGTPVTFSAGAVGGSGAYEFEVGVYQEATASWSLVQDYSPRTRATWTPTATESATYTVTPSATETATQTETATITPTATESATVTRLRLKNFDAR